ncbi:MAG TPA: class I SAM-dependent methyltransferase [Burkholderiales bacterium]|jgi:SAM-dependent methyltransferase|nr:class I SAM-dependent methyltransferase [Burkholderiales bacterium]
MAQGNDITADSQVARIFEWRRGFNAIHLIDLGVHLGLFRALAESPGQEAAALASKLGLQPHYVGVWCRTAYGLELLDADEQGRFRLAPHMDAILASATHPRYLGGYVRLGTEVAAEDFRRCREAFRTGQSRPFQGRGEHFNQAIAESTQGLQVVTAKKILPSLAGLADRLAAGGALLEVGCGTGNFLLQAAKAFPNARLAGVDIDDESLAAAREKIRKAGLEGRVSAHKEKVDDATNAFDAVVMIEVLHEIGPGIRPAVVAGAARALRPGGWMVIIDETYPTTLEEARRPEFRFPLQTGFEELLWGNVIPTREEQEKLLRDAGLKGAIGRELIGEGFTVLTVQR